MFKYEHAYQAIEAGDLEEFKKMHLSNFPLDTEHKPSIRFINWNQVENQQSFLTIIAAGNGQLDCLKYLSENGFQWNKNTVLNATKNGHLECLRYLRENGCEWDIFGISEYAAENGHLECLRFAFENGCVCNEETMTDAAINGHLDCLRFLAEIGCEWSTEVIANAAGNGHLDCLKYLFESGCPWDNFTTKCAAKYGYLDCLKYAVENGCPYDYFTIAEAAKEGHLDCLRYLREKGCGYNSLTPVSAAKNGHLDCFKYIVEDCSKLQILFTVKYDLSKVINDIDLKDKVWSKLLTVDLSKNPDLEEKVNARIKEIEELKNASKEVLRSILPLDIIQHCIHPMIL